MAEAGDEVVTVRLPSAELAELDALARTVARDRSVLIVEAVGAYLALHRWQVAVIEEGLRQADAGEFATDAEVEAAYAAFPQASASTRQDTACFSRL